jgi:hypothetical protein
VISKDGKRDGEDISAAKNDDGNLFVMKMANKLNVLKSGEIGEQKYPWKNIGEPWARMKVSRFIYFVP